MSAPIDAKTYIEQRAASEPELYAQVSDLYQKRLWHQLTQHIVALIEHWQEGGVQSELALSFYHSFLRDFETRLNPLSLAQIVVGLSRLVYRQDAKNAIVFLRHTLGEKGHIERNVAARTLYTSELVRLLLRTGDAADLEEAGRLQAEAASLVAAAAGALDPAVSSAYYRAASDYYKVMGSAADFYRHALAFLSCTPTEVLSPDERVEWALDIGMAALLGKDIYNLGEVRQCEVIRALADQAETDWFYRLLVAFETGNIEVFERMVAHQVAEPRIQEMLHTNMTMLSQKIRLLRFMRLAAFDATYAGRIPFADAAAECQVALDEVEHMVMKALSEGLVQGSIDQVDQIIIITHVQPRVLDRQDVAKMVGYLESWEKRTDEMLHGLQSESQELLSPT
ncbi:26S proteasome non-ATPase regulatory subunit 13 [Cyanidiococcus yangmingshanensis]|uniref:26S proteasome non-ATPase regulatory subunit 13 n=1 Tax=Cyanidiococcus yangmingshanensis TaxID=2690220 RepID=A0A7J7ILE7_9RHOD|nr:26S proteasome non-ATPase regulatory subunit 13 [Cyanidiococcus yangmingshanensis]